MLQNLKIENYALIRKMDIPFNKGFIAITGETGAGKSIMLGALGLILGQRADSNVLWDKEKKCIVEAVFELDDSFNAFFDANDLDFSSQTTIRREITSNGKSRAFINESYLELSFKISKTISVSFSGFSFSIKGFISSILPPSLRIEVIFCISSSEKLFINKSIKALFLSTFDLLFSLCKEEL